MMARMQAARMSDIKLDMLLDDGSLQAARLSDIKLDMLLDDNSLKAAHIGRH